MYIIEYNKGDDTAYIVLKGSRFHLDYNVKKLDAYRFSNKENALTYYNCMCAGMDPIIGEEYYAHLKLVPFEE